MNRRQRAIGAARVWLAEPIGIIESLQRRLPSGTNRAMTNRIDRISLELDYPPFHHARDDPTAGGTFGAGGGIKSRDARDDVLVRNHIWNQLSGGRLTTGYSGGGRGRGR